MTFLEIWPLDVSTVIDKARCYTTDMCTQCQAITIQFHGEHDISTAFGLGAAPQQTHFLNFAAGNPYFFCVVRLRGPHGKPFLAS